MSLACKMKRLLAFYNVPALRRSMKSWIARLLLFAVLAGGSRFTLAQSARLEHLPDGQVNSSQLIWRLLPYPRTYLEPHIEPGQTAKLVFSGATDLILVPVAYGGGEKDNLRPHLQCGVYLLPRKGQQTYVSVIGPDFPALCEGTDAIGLMSDPGPRPRLIVLNQTLSDHGDEAVIPFILEWNETK